MRPRRRTILIVGGAAAATLAIIGCAIALPAVLAAPTPAPTSTSLAIDGPTVQITRQDLTRSTDLDGLLGYGAALPVGVQGTGTVTWLPAVGQPLDLGTQLFRVDDRPIVVFLGDIPLFRPLDAPGLRGPDVSMVAQNLMALGRLRAGDPAKATVSPAFTAAVRAWQKGLGVAQTGIIAPGDVQVIAGPARVAAVVAHLGGAPADRMADITGLTKVVTMDLRPSVAGPLQSGATVGVVLPDGTEVPAVISGVGTQVSTDDSAGGSSSEATLVVTVAIADQAALTAFDSAPVTVRVVSENHPGVLVVPIAALLALDEGGYALQTPEGMLIGVTTGLFTDESVEVAGDGVVEGLTVVTAR